MSQAAPKAKSFSTLVANRRHVRLVRRILGIAWHIHKKMVVAYFAGALLETGAFIASIYATARLSSLLATYVAHGPHAASGQIWFWLWVDVASIALTTIGFWIMNSCKRLLYFRMVRWATYQFQAAMCRLDLPDFYDDEIRNQIDKAQSGYVWQISQFNESSLDLLYGIIRFLGTAVVVAQITWWLIPLIAVFLIPSLLAESKLAKVQWFVWDDQGDTRHIFWGLEWLIRRPQNQMELRSSQARQYVLERVEGLNRDFYQKQEQRYQTSSRFVMPAKLLEVTGTAFGSVVLLRQFLRGSIPLDRYFFLSGALLRIGGALNNIFGTLSRMQEQFLFVDNYFAVIDRQPRFVDKPQAVALRPHGSPRIEFEHVSFTYPGQTTAVFDDLSFVIEPGQRLAIVGENGAGKSTLIKLLLRFYQPTGGRILIDGQDLQDVAIESWYDHLATLFQEFNHYPFSIAENIEVARPQYRGDRARLRQAAGLSNVDTFVSKYQHGWETVLDNSFEKGVEPSGGQWQRVALARAFYRQASVLILDEPTAAIDARAEYDIFNNIFEHFSDKTAIIVSHRFSTVRRADIIMVVDNGKIIESGSHRQLMKRQGLYHELFTKQAEGYRQ
jgi:ATP-binding cassette, subfamily B, bacterial